MFRKVIILSLLIVSSFSLCSCSNSAETTYESSRYTINNNVDESYSVEYREMSGFPDHSVEIRIHNTDGQIVEYITQYKKEFLPKDIIYLFDYENNKYYYIASDVGESIFIAGDKKNFDYKYTDYEFSLNVDFLDKSKKYVSDYIILAERMRVTIKEEDIIDSFSKCNYKSDKIIELYNLK